MSFWAKSCSVNQNRAKAFSVHDILYYFQLPEIYSVHSWRVPDESSSLNRRVLEFMMWVSAQMCRPTRLKFSILSSIFSHILVLSFLKHIIESILKNTATELRTNFSTFSPRVIFCAHYFLINNPQQQRISELTTEVDLLQDSSSECIWTSSSKRSKCKETQPVLKWFFFSWLHGFHLFSVIQISSHLGHLHLHLWKTILNWSRSWRSILLAQKRDLVV